VTRTLVASIFIGSAAVLIAAAINSTPDAGFTVHEWGTFTSVAGPDGSGATWNALGCKDDLPTFVNHAGASNTKFALMGNVRMETPVLYFYSARELQASVKVDFTDGIITEWYPSSARTPSGGLIEWRNIHVQPGATPQLPLESLPSRYYAARVTDSAPLAVNGQHEKFLFYRGVGSMNVPLTARVAADGSITIASGPDPVPLVLLFENRGGRIGFRNIGALEKSVTLDSPPLDQSVRQLNSELESALVEQGLYQKEAQAMLATWQDSWFEEGSRLIYIVPQQTLARVLPLQVYPPPAETARVFVGRIELITTATERAVEDAITRGDRTALAPYARFLAPILKRIASEDHSKPGLAANVAACP
jgi:hypothetical protein